MQPLVSIVLVAYNHARYVDAALHSARQQTYPNIEIIVVDDGSTDGTTQICAHHAASDARIHFIAQSNQGLSRALNQGLQAVTGHYVAMLASDDAFVPDKTTQQVQALAHNGALGGVFTYVDYINDQGISVAGLGALFNTAYTPEQLVRQMMVANVLCATSVMLRTDMVRQVGLFATDLNYTQDYDYWLRLLLHGPLLVLPEKLTRYRVHATNLSSSDPIASARETSHVLRRHLTSITRRYPFLLSDLEPTYEAAGALAYQAGAWRDAADVFASKRQLFTRHYERDGMRLLDCLMRLESEQEARALLRILYEDRSMYTPSTRATLEQFATRYLDGTT